jgi:hypothetical protein
VYIRTFIEYYCKLWDNCGIGNSPKLELNFDTVSTFRILLFKVFHLVIVEGIKESLVEDSLRKVRVI